MAKKRIKRKPKYFGNYKLTKKGTFTKKDASSIYSALKEHKLIEYTGAARGRLSRINRSKEEFIQRLNLSTKTNKKLFAILATTGFDKKYQPKAPDIIKVNKTPYANMDVEVVKGGEFKKVPHYMKKAGIEYKTEHKFRIKQIKEEGLQRFDYEGRYNALKNPVGPGIVPDEEHQMRLTKKRAKYGSKKRKQLHLVRETYDEYNFESSTRVRRTQIRIHAKNLLHRKTLLGRSAIEMEAIRKYAKYKGFVDEFIRNPQKIQTKEGKEIMKIFKPTIEKYLLKEREKVIGTRYEQDFDHWVRGGSNDSAKRLALMRYVAEVAKTNEKDWISSNISEISVGDIIEASDESD